MRRSRAAILTVFLLSLAGAGVLGALGVGAQERSAPAARTPEEQSALDLLAEDKLVSARTAAQKALEANRNSLVGHYVLGVVLHRAEGSLPRAMFHLGRAREIYETTWSASARSAGAPWALHRDLLFRVQALAGELELHEYRLEVLGYHDYLYDPDLLAQRAWPLIQLGRYDEAREFAKKAVESGDAWQRSTGLNALCAVEGEAGRRGRAYEACLEALENARGQRAEEGGEAGAVAVHAYNAALAARSDLRFQEAERLAIEGARRLEFTPANPWRLLVWQRVEAGRLSEAVEGVREMRRWRARQPAYLRDQARADTDAVLATLLLAAGEAEMGLRAVDRALAQPDRRGLVTSDPEQALGAHALIRRALAVTHREQLRERAGADGFLGRWVGEAAALGSTPDIVADEERVVRALSDGDRLVRTLRHFVRGGLEPLPGWLVGDLVDVLGPGVVAVALRGARAAEPDDRLDPFHDAVEAEIALARGESARALGLAEAALSALPERESMWRGRVAAVGADAARAEGRRARALALYEEAMQLDGGAIRRLGLSLPARIHTRAGSSALGSEVADALGRSPRFRDETGFEVVVAGVGGAAVRACLRSPHGAELGCAEVDPEALAERHEAATERYEETREAALEAGVDVDDLEPPDPPEPVLALVRAFHDRLFSAPVTLSATDLGSLDGRTTTGEDLARERFRQLLGTPSPSGD